MLRVNLMRLQLASGTVAYGRIPPVHRADLEGQLSVELTSSPRRRVMSAICAIEQLRRLGDVANRRLADIAD
jgi:hypothetical protein